MVTCSLWYPFGAQKTTYSLRFSITFTAAFGTPLTTVLSTARSLFAISLRHCASSLLLSPTAWYHSQPVLKTQRQQPTIFISMITLAMENAILTGLVLTKSGTLLMSVCANHKATPRRSFVNAFRSETFIWESSCAIVEVRLVSSQLSSSRCVQCQSFRPKESKTLQLTLTHSGTWQTWNAWL